MQSVTNQHTPAPGCYCSSLPHECDFCRGYRVFGRPDLASPAKVKAAAALLGITPREAARELAEASHG